jgi:hypothetical protein
MQAGQWSGMPLERFNRFKALFVATVNLPSAEIMPNCCSPIHILVQIVANVPFQGHVKV